MKLDDVLRLSPFVAQVAQRQPEVLDPAVWGSPCFFEDADFAALKNAVDLADLMAKSRLLRRKYTAIIAIRDYLGLDAVPQTLARLTGLADRVVSACLDWVHADLAVRHGEPVGAVSGEPQRLTVLGMGKLGGGELNFSSDIDLIACFAEGGETAGPQVIDNQQFFIRLVQRLTRVLAEQTADGFVYRVDWRLRPFGGAGPLAVSFEAMEQYYAVHGRDWERYALVKARPVAGDLAAGGRLLARLEPFVYRRYLDFSAIESLRELKAQIDLQVRQKGQRDNIKRGPGGIREVEFWVQAFQLIWGGRHPALRTPSLYAALDAVAALGLVQADEVARQRADYDFLRRVENHLQAYADEQTHTLPQDAPRQQALAASLGYETYALLLADLDAARQRVQARFDALFGDADAVADGVWRRLWLSPESASHPWAERLAAFHAQPLWRGLSATAQARLDEVMPLLLAALSEQGCGETGLVRLLDFVAAVARRSVYLLLLKASEAARAELVRLLCASGWLAQMLIRHPALLEWLLDTDALYQVASPEAYRAEAEAVLASFGEDEEAFMAQLRHWKQRAVFQVAAQDVMGVLPVMRVSDQLTAIAEAVLSVAHRWVMDWMARKHGHLPGGELMIIGYGKLGGYELGYGSDLDVVFLYEGVSADDWSEGGRPLDGQTWMIRAAQKLLFVLTTQMVGGRLYEVDTRLRPNGQDGLLAVSLKSYGDYLRQKAWLWELQALVRARAVVATDAARAAFERLRCDMLRQARDESEVRAEVAAMRRKMLAHLDKSTAECFDVKQGRGGLVDIEFFIQCQVLAHAAERAVLCHWTDNVRLLVALADAGVLTPDEADALKHHYLFYRALLHRRVLAGEGGCVPREQVEGVSRQVRRLVAPCLKVESQG